MSDPPKNKKPSAQDMGEAFAHSRGAGMAEQLQNFRDAPLTGHGFGVYREGVRGGEAGVKRFMGIPLSASAEKGVVFTSVLEETGIVGGLLFYALLIAIVAAAARGAVPGATAMVIGCTVVNFGEAIIFSTGGMGLLMWLLTGSGSRKPGSNRYSGPRRAVRSAGLAGGAGRSSGRERKMQYSIRKRVMVTGGAGFLGSHLLCDRLIADIRKPQLAESV